MSNPYYNLNDNERDEEVNVGTNHNQNKLNNDEDIIVKQQDWSVEIRLGFIRKVYGILSVQLVITFLMCLYSVTNKGYALFQQTHTGIFWLSFILGFIIIIVLSCFRNICRTVPINYILLFAFTVCESYMVSFVCSISDPEIVLMAAAMTAGVVIGLTIYAVTTKTDFTMLGGILFVFLSIMILFGIFLLFTDNDVVHIIYSCLGVFLFSIYLIHDTQLIIGNHELKLSVDEYIFAALNLYLDIINLFLYILDILSRSKK